MRGVTFVVILAACGGDDDSGGGGSEMWRADLTGSNAPGHCSLGGDKGEFAESHTVLFTFGSSIVAGLRNGTNVMGTGSFAGGETVTRQSAYPDICMLVATSVSAVDVRVTYSGILSGIGPAFRFGSILDEPLIIDRYSNPQTGNNDAPIDSIEMRATSQLTDSMIAGEWVVSGSGSVSGNSAQGAFIMTKTAGGGGSGSGVDAAIESDAVVCESSQTPLPAATCSGSLTCPSYTCQFDCDGSNCQCKQNGSVLATQTQTTECDSQTNFNTAKNMCSCFP